MTPPRIMSSAGAPPARETIGDTQPSEADRLAGRPAQEKAQWTHGSLPEYPEFLLILYAPCFPSEQGDSRVHRAGNRAQPTRQVKEPLGLDKARPLIRGLVESSAFSKCKTKIGASRILIADLKNTPHNTLLPAPLL